MITVKGIDDQPTFLKSLNPKLGLSQTTGRLPLEHINLIPCKISFIDFYSKVKSFSIKHHAWHFMNIGWIKPTLGFVLALTVMVFLDKVLCKTFLENSVFFEKWVCSLAQTFLLVLLLL